jgi:hypothetical protein
LILFEAIVLLELILMDKQVVVYLKSMWWLGNKRADNKKGSGIWWRKITTFLAVISF